MFQYLFIALLCFSCVQPGIEDDKEKWVIPNIEGHWKVHDVEIVEEIPFLGIEKPEPDPMAMAHEDSPWDHYTEYDLVFKNDTMYSMYYPVQSFRPQPYFLDSGYLHIGNRDSLGLLPLEFIRDTMYMYTPVRTDPGFFKETYVRTMYNDSILDVLKNYRINYPALAGTWYLVRELDYDYGTHYELQFPHELPDSIEFSREEMIEALDGEKVKMISTDGIKREYTFSYYYGDIHVHPGEWCEEDDPWIFFGKYY